MALEDIHRLPPGSFSVHCHRPEDFLIFFATKEVRDRVLREVDLHIVEPDEPPSLEDLAAPAQAVIPPHINTLAYPLLIHVTSTADFRRSTPRQGPGDRVVDGDGSTPAWPTRRQYTYTRGIPDVLPGNGGGGNGAVHPAPSGHGGGGHGGNTRVLASGAIVGELAVDQSRRVKRRKRGGRKVRELRARAAAANAAGEETVVELAAIGADDDQVVAAESAAAAMDDGRSRTGDGGAAVGAADDRVTHGESAAAAGAVRVVAAASAAAADDVGIGAPVTACHAPLHASVDLLVHGPVQRPVDQVMVAQRAVVADARVVVGPLTDSPAFPVLEASAAVSNLAETDGGASGGSFRVGAFTVSFPASPRDFSAREPPSLQTLDSVAGPFVPRMQLGLEAFANLDSPVEAHQDGPFGQEVAGPFGQDDAGPDDVDRARCQALILSAPPSPTLEVARVVETGATEVGVGDDEAVDEEIVVDPPPSQEETGVPLATSPSTCRFASPPLVFQRARQASAPRASVPLARPRTLGEFLEAAKSRSDAILRTPAVRRRLVELNFQPRRSSRIAKQPGGMDAEMRAVRNLMRKLGLLSGDEAPTAAALEAYHKMYELPLTDDMIEAIAEFYGWTLSSIRGCSPPMLGMSGGRLVAA
jgi:hypothetical protein